MLTAALRVYHWDRPSSSICSDRLEDGALPILARAVALYRRAIGRRRGEIRNAARRVLEGLRPDRVEPVVKLLDDVSDYELPRGEAHAERRLLVFTAAAGRRAVLTPAEARDLVEREFGSPPAPVAALYADYPEFHRLRAFPEGYTAGDLRGDYDLAQAQALLYAAASVTVEARSGFKHIIQHARLARLLHVLERTPEGYRFTFDGPNSILRRTRAYGADFARFLGALVRVQDWQLAAEIVLRKGWRPLTFTLSDRDGLRSRRPSPALFDSRIEAALAHRFGSERAGWRLSREAVVLQAGARLLVPDFLFTHADGTRVALEIVGYWTPEYLRAKLDKLAGVRGQHLIVAVRRGLAVGSGDLPADVLPFRTRVLLRDLLPRLEACRPAGPPPARP
jgi:predicted nuclease of restriction endonuclease-like RecB superfamily